MACSQRSGSGCPCRHHYPTRSPVVINDKRLEYWFVNLQSGAIRCRPPNYTSLTNAERAGRRRPQLRIVASWDFKTGSQLLYQPLSTGVQEGCVFMWGWGSEPGATGWSVLNPHTHSVSQDIRLDWWFVMAAGSLSISFTDPPPPRCRSPICSCAALRGNQDSHTLRAGTTTIGSTHTAWTPSSVCLQTWGWGAWAQKFEEWSLRVSYIRRQMIQALVVTVVFSLQLFCGKLC